MSSKKDSRQQILKIDNEAAKKVEAEVRKLLPVVFDTDPKDGKITMYEVYKGQDVLAGTRVSPNVEAQRAADRINEITGGQFSSPKAREKLNATNSRIRKDLETEIDNALKGEKFLGVPLNDVIPDDFKNKTREEIFALVSEKMEAEMKTTDLTSWFVEPSSPEAVGKKPAVSSRKR